MKLKLIIILLILIPILSIVFSGTLYMYLDGSYWPLTKEIAKNNFLNEFRSFVVNNASSGYDKNLFTGSRIFSNGIIYLLVTKFGVLGGKIAYIISAFLLLVHALYLVASRFFIENKYNALLFGIFFGVSGIFINSTNQIYLYTIPAIFYSLYFSLIFIKTGKYRYLIPLILSGYFLLGYIRYVMFFGILFISTFVILYQDIKHYVSIKKIIFLGLCGIIAFFIPLLSFIHLLTSSIPTSTSSFAEQFTQYYPQVSTQQLIHYYYAFNFEREFNIVFIYSWMIGVGIILFAIFGAIKHKSSTWKIRGIFYAVILFVILYLTISIYKEGYFIILKFLPLIQNQPLYLTYLPMFFGALGIFTLLKTRLLIILTCVSVIGFGLYWNSFNYFANNKIQETIDYTHEIGKKGYNFINTPTLYLPHALLDYKEFKSINLHDFTNFPSIGVNNSRLFFGNTHQYNKSIRTNTEIDINNYKLNTNLKLIKVSKHIDNNKYIEKKRLNDEVQILSLEEKGDIQLIGEDEYYKYYSVTDVENNDFFLNGKKDGEYIEIDIFVNDLNDDGYILKINEIGNIELNFLTSFSNNWKLIKIEDVGDLTVEKCHDFSSTKNTYCVIQESINSYIFGNLNSDFNISGKETIAGRNIFNFENNSKGQVYILYYESHPIKKYSQWIVNIFSNNIEK